MDVEGVSQDKLSLTFTPKGVAAIWLRAHFPSAEQADIDDLATVIGAIYFDGVKHGINHSRKVMSQSPTMSAADATLEADRDELVREHKPKDELDFDPSEYAKGSIYDTDPWG